MCFAFLKGIMLPNKAKTCSLILCLVLFVSSYSYATIFVLPELGDLVGKVQYTQSEMGETIDEVGRRFNMGYYEMVRANPHAEAIYPLALNTQLIIPSQFILPNVPRRGIVINLAEYRLYYFPADENIVITFPVGIGKEGWNTPLGLTKITAKLTNPAWRPTADVLAAAEQIGAPIPGFFPPGPNNPLGKHALRLGWPTFLIHGTNRADGVGARVSAGCIRMLPGDIKHLFNLVSIGTSVRVINEPVKIGKQEDGIYIQMHPILVEKKNTRSSNKVNIKKWINNKIFQNELSYPSGLVKRING
jgi:L,D-transpeptidase ErfK/SrfK